MTECKKDIRTRNVISFEQQQHEKKRHIAAKHNRYTLRCHCLRFTVVGHRRTGKTNHSEFHRLLFPHTHVTLGHSKTDAHRSCETTVSGHFFFLFSLFIVRVRHLKAHNLWKSVKKLSIIESSSDRCRLCCTHIWCVASQSALLALPKRHAKKKTQREKRKALAQINLLANDKSV